MSQGQSSNDGIPRKERQRQRRKVSSGQVWDVCDVCDVHFEDKQRARWGAIGGTRTTHNAHIHTYTM